jgi:hypothetical protein
MRHAAFASLAIALGAAACAGVGERPAKPSPASRGALEETTTAATTAPNEPVARAGAPAFKPLRQPERRWVRRYAEWRDDLVSPIATIDDIRATWQYFLLDPDYGGRPVAKYLRTLAKVDRCARSLARNVRKPPGSKLAEAYELLEKACKLMRSSAASDRSAIAAKDTDAFVHRADWGEAFLRYQEADEAVLAHLMFMRPLPVKRGRTGESRIEPVFSDVATRISDEHQQVRCWSKRDWGRVLKDRSAYAAGKIEPSLLGFAGLAEPAHLSPEICEELVALHYGRARPEGEDEADLAEAVVVLAHEAEHVVGTANEAVTECRAMQRLREAARLLGALKASAASLAETFWVDVYPYNAPAYKTDRCRDGGPLDLRPKSAVWP